VKQVNLFRVLSKDFVYLISKVNNNNVHNTYKGRTYKVLYYYRNANPLEVKESTPPQSEPVIHVLYEKVILLHNTLLLSTSYVYKLPCKDGKARKYL